MGKTRNFIYSGHIIVLAWLMPFHVAMVHGHGDPADERGIWEWSPEEIKKENKTERYEHNNTGPGMIQFLLGPQMDFCVQSVGFMPKVGDIVIFPAWLPHYVNDFKSDVERISVSGNLNFMYHDLSPINVETGKPELGLDD